MNVAVNDNFLKSNTSNQAQLKLGEQSRRAILTRPLQIQAPSDALRLSGAGKPSAVLASLPLVDPCPTLEQIQNGAVLEPGDTGASVTAMQNWLTKLGFGVQATGTFGPTTQGLLIRFQRLFGIEPTGKLGPTTLKVLQNVADSPYRSAIARSAEQVAQNRQTVGQCYNAVAESVGKHMGDFLWGMSAYQAAEQFANHPGFVEIPVRGEELRDLPAGAIVVWGKGRSEHGHISVALGDGREASDHVAAQMTSHYGGGKPRVFFALHT